MISTGKLVLATIGGAHGLKGEVRLKTYTADPLAIGDYGPLEAADGRAFRVTAVRPAARGAADMVIARLSGVDDRTAAETLTGHDLSVPRDRLPPPAEDDYYHADLIGLAAITREGRRLGTVVAVPNHGSGDLLEIARGSGGTVLVPFTRSAVPEVDIAGGRVVIDPPPGLLDEGEEGGSSGLPAKGD